MKTRRLGRTGLQVAELIFGGGYVGGLLLHQDDDTKRMAIRRALDGGMNWIDTAASYGNGESEKALGWLLKELEPDRRPYLSTKFEIDLTHLNDIAGQIEQSLYASLKRLERDSVQLVQLHNRIEPQLGQRALTPEVILAKNGVADSLQRLREQGLFDFFGITALGDAHCCRQVIGSGRFDTAQVYYNMLNPSAGLTAGERLPEAWGGHDFSGLLAACETHDVGVMNIRVFAAGVLATDSRHGREIVITRDAEVATEERRTRVIFDKLGGQYGSRAQTAIRFALANSAIAGVVIGLAELSHLDDALAAAERGPLPQAALDEIDGVYAAGFR